MGPTAAGPASPPLSAAGAPSSTALPPTPHRPPAAPRAGPGPSPRPPLAPAVTHRPPCAGRYPPPRPSPGRSPHPPTLAGRRPALGRPSPPAGRLRTRPSPAGPPGRVGASPRPHLLLGLAVALQGLLGQVPHAELPVLAGHHDPRPPEAHGHFHLSGPPCPARTETAPAAAALRCAARPGPARPEWGVWRGGAGAGGPAAPAGACPRPRGAAGGGPAGARGAPGAAPQRARAAPGARPRPPASFRRGGPLCPPLPARLSGEARAGPGRAGRPRTAERGARRGGRGRRRRSPGARRRRAEQGRPCRSGLKGTAAPRGSARRGRRGARCPALAHAV